MLNKTAKVWIASTEKSANKSDRHRVVFSDNSKYDIAKKYQLRSKLIRTANQAYSPRPKLWVGQLRGFQEVVNHGYIFGREQHRWAICHEIFYPHFCCPKESTWAHVNRLKRFYKPFRFSVAKLEIRKYAQSTTSQTHNFLLL